MSISIQNIAKQFGYTICGNTALYVDGIRFSAEAKENDIAIAFSAKDIEMTKAKVVLTVPRIAFTQKTLMYCHGNIYTAAIEVAEWMVKKGLYEDYSLHPVYHQNECGVYLGNDVLIGADTSIAPMALIGDHVRIGNHCKIDSNVKIGSGTIIGDHVCISFGSYVGADSFYHAFEEHYIPFCGIGTTMIGDHVTIGSHTIIQRGTFSDTVIGDHTVIANLIDIGHDVKIGKDCRIVSQSGIAGNAVIEDYVQIFGQSGVNNQVRIGRRSVIKAKSVVTKDVKSDSTISGLYGREAKDELKLEAKLRRYMKEAD